MGLITEQRQVPGPVVYGCPLLTAAAAGFRLAIIAGTGRRLMLIREKTSATDARGAR